jgi:hypothetical protein
MVEMELMGLVAEEVPALTAESVELVVKEETV